ncbi:MAG: endolytic transglycosylase MltG [Saprospiraceae bacterium]|nr:endolytic transglycosylase MltG [Saprospiraceae bacterium]
MRKKNIFISLFVLGAGAVVFYCLFAPNVSKVHQSYFLEIKPVFSWSEIEQNLVDHKVLKNNKSFQLTSYIFSFSAKKWKAGRYKINKGMSNFDIFKKLLSGAQDPVMLVINNVRDIYQLAGKLDPYLMIDSTDILNTLSDTLFLDSLGYNLENILSMILPNSYEVFWTIQTKALFLKLKAHHDKFWESESRLMALRDVGLSQVQAYTLASIVEKESQYLPERNMIAGVYLNRLKRGMKLQADPTAVFASGLDGVQRVNYDILNVDSPYNTYKVVGLPPGPIYMPSINSIEAVLNADKHEYIFFCALPGYEGRHSFAKTAEQHFENARIYRKWLDQQNIH